MWLIVLIALVAAVLVAGVLVTAVVARVLMVAIAELVEVDEVEVDATTVAELGIGLHLLWMREGFLSAVLVLEAGIAGVVDFVVAVAAFAVAALELAGPGIAFEAAFETEFEVACELVAFGLVVVVAVASVVAFGRAAVGMSVLLGVAADVEVPVLELAVRLVLVAFGLAVEVGLEMVAFDFEDSVAAAFQDAELGAVVSDEAAFVVVAWGAEFGEAGASAFGAAVFAAFPGAATGATAFVVVAFAAGIVVVG